MAERLRRRAADPLHMGSIPIPGSNEGENMRDFVRHTREVINALIEVEQIWRKTAPDCELSSEDTEKIVELLSKVKMSVDLILKSVQGG